VRRQHVRIHACLRGRVRGGGGIGGPAGTVVGGGIVRLERSAGVRDHRCRHKPRWPHDCEPGANAVSCRSTEHGALLHLLAACCASPDSMICRLSSSPSLTQSHLQVVSVSFHMGTRKCRRDMAGKRVAHAVLRIQHAVVARDYAHGVYQAAAEAAEALVAAAAARVLQI
jgi:hypothetical protein